MKIGILTSLIALSASSAFALEGDFVRAASAFTAAQTVRVSFEPSRPVALDPNSVLSEFFALRNAISRITEANAIDGLVGGLMYEKRFDGYSLLWTTVDHPGDSQTIRLFRERPDGTPFAVSYHWGTHLMEGRHVVRRFVGPELGGWRADTVDSLTGEYLESQGVEAPVLFAAEEAILGAWGIGRSFP